MSATQRESSYLITIIDAGQSESDVVQFYPFAGGMILIPSGWTSAQIGFKSAANINDTYNPLYSDTGTLVSISGVSTDRWYVLPANVSNARYFKLWSQNGAVSVNQAAERSITVVLKS